VELPRLPLSIRLSTVAFVAAAFLGGLSAGLVGAHAVVESDAPLAEVGDPAALRGAHGDRVKVHGLVVDHRIDAGDGPGATTFTYNLVLDDGTARREFAVPRPDYDRTLDGRWIVIPLRWTGSDYEAGPPERAIQPWMWRTTLLLGAATVVAGAASRVFEKGIVMKRRGDFVELREPQKR